MGAQESSEKALARDEEKELEAVVTRAGGHLPTLQKAFSRLSSSPNAFLKDCFSLRCKKLESKLRIPNLFPNLLDNIGQALVDLFFTSENGRISWIEFLRGYVRCCGRFAATQSLSTLYRVYADAGAKAGIPLKFDFPLDSDSSESECNISGCFALSDVLIILWFCWITVHDSRTKKSEECVLVLPEVNHLLYSVLLSCELVDSELKFVGVDNLDWSLLVSAEKFHKWVLTTVPALSSCFPQYVNARIQAASSTMQAVTESCTQSPGDCSTTEDSEAYLLTCGCAWAVSLTLRNFSSEELMEACFPRRSVRASDNILYRSSVHGKGLSRFWSNVQGYRGPILLLIAASVPNTHENHASSSRCVIGILVQQSFENRDVYYGNSGFLYALHPVFQVFASSGKDKNFVYSHLRPTGRYETNPKPVGIGFGGSIGNERVFLDEDFACIIVRHHAVDKTYHPGPLVPNQGFLAVEASVIEVEVWGLGGKSAKQGQDAYKKREVLFTEQRRKVDLKTFGNWEDSPEKMLMDMVSDPNKVQREDR